LSSGEVRGIGTGEGDKVLMAEEGAGLWADDEEDIWAQTEVRRDELMADNGFAPG
jgi:hypothetical protein